MEAIIVASIVLGVGVIWNALDITKLKKKIEAIEEREEK